MIRAVRIEQSPAQRQATWFGVAETPPPPPGPFAAVVFNRPIDQVLSYHVPSGLERMHPAGSARAGATGTRQQADGRLCRAR